MSVSQYSVKGLSAVVVQSVEMVLIQMLHYCGNNEDAVKSQEGVWCVCVCESASRSLSESLAAPL